MNDTENLFNEICKIIEKEKKDAKEKGNDFNIFTGRCFDERFMCDVLVKLINPKEHINANILLKHFLKEVLDLDKNISITEVKREEVCNGRPIDIMLCGENVLIPIEVKINAKDQPYQLYDYAQNSTIHEPKIYYLTKNGHKPSKESIRARNGNDWLTTKDFRCISWETHIIQWLEKCLADKNIKHKRPITEILEQFKDAIREIINQRGKEMEEIVKFIINSKNIEIAAKIKDAYPKIMGDLWNYFKQQIKDTIKDRIVCLDDNRLAYLIETDFEGVRTCSVIFIENEIIYKNCARYNKNGEWIEFVDKTKKSKKIGKLIDLSDQKKEERCIKVAVNFINKNKQFN